MSNKKENFASYAQLIYTLIPFTLLIIIKIYKNEWEQIILTPDWGIAASLLFGQAQAKIISAGLKNSISNANGYQFYNSLRILYLMIALSTFTLMSIEPNFVLAIFQIVFFIFSIIIFIKDSITAQKIINIDNSKPDNNLRQ